MALKPYYSVKDIKRNEEQIHVDALAVQEYIKKNGVTKLEAATADNAVSPFQKNSKIKEGMQ
jgi:hypothetical protein